MRKKKEGTIIGGKIIKWLMNESGTTISSMAKERNVSRPTVYANIESKEISLEVFTELVEACGYRVLVGKVVDGKAQGLKSVRWFMKEDIE